MTSAGRAAASDGASGQRPTKATKGPLTRATWVCCSIVSLTRIHHASRVVRHGRSRRVSADHANRHSASGLAATLVLRAVNPGGAVRSSRRREGSVRAERTSALACYLAVGVAKTTTLSAYVWLAESNDPPQVTTTKRPTTACQRIAWRQTLQTDEGTPASVGGVDVPVDHRCPLRGARLWSARPPPQGHRIIRYPQRAPGRHGFGYHRGLDMEAGDDQPDRADRSGQPPTKIEQRGDACARWPPRRRDPSGGPGRRRRQSGQHGQAGHGPRGDSRRPVCRRDCPCGQEQQQCQANQHPAGQPARARPDPGFGHRSAHPNDRRRPAIASTASPPADRPATKHDHQATTPPSPAVGLRSSSAGFPVPRRHRAHWQMCHSQMASS